MHRCFVFFHHIGLPLSFKDWAAPSSYISTPLAGAFGLQSSIFVLTNCQNKINLMVLAQDNLCCCPEQQQLMILSITIHHTSALTSYVDMASTSQFYCTDHTYIYILIYICWDIYIYILILIDASRIFQVIWNTIQKESVRSTKPTFCRRAFSPKGVQATLGVFMWSPAKATCLAVEDCPYDSWQPLVKLSTQGL